MGYVYQAGDLGRWYVGLQAFTVGSSFLANRDFVAQSHPYMRRLMEQSGETANLAILDGTEAVFIDQVQCREMMRTIVKLGSRVPLHASGVGKAIFAALPDEQIDAILKVKGLPRITDNTITSPETMWASIRVIRQRGWSFDDEEHRSARAASRRRSTTSTPSRWARSRSPDRRRGCPTSASGSWDPSSRTPPRSSRAGSAAAGRTRTEVARGSPRTARVRAAASLVGQSPQRPAIRAAAPREVRAAAAAASAPAGRPPPPKSLQASTMSQPAASAASARATMSPAVVRAGHAEVVGEDEAVEAEPPAQDLLQPDRASSRPARASTAG